MKSKLNWKTYLVMLLVWLVAWATGCAAPESSANPGTVLASPPSPTVAVNTPTLALSSTPTAALSSTPSLTPSSTATATNSPSSTRTSTSTQTPTVTRTATPAFTPTPVLPPRFVEMPWGKVNLDPSVEETNHYANAFWCQTLAGLVRPERLPMWATNPVGMSSGAYAVQIFNARVTGKDADWKTDKDGNKSLDVYALAYDQRDPSKTYPLTITVFPGTKWATYIPSDKRVVSRPGIVPVGQLTDPNSIRVGQIYGVTRYTGDIRWMKPVKEIPWVSLFVQDDFSFLVTYTVAPAWEDTCDYLQQQGLLK